jgi:hypothetical protein
MANLEQIEAAILSLPASEFEGENGISWFWIGTHAEYDQLIGKL